MTDTIRPTTRPENSFEFVTVASARARQLLQGCLPKLEGSAKPARRALQEVAAGIVTKVEPDEAESVEPDA
jgi:DNA-directed RNA polymerase subunit K/omega